MVSQIDPDVIPLPYPVRRQAAGDAAGHAVQLRERNRAVLIGHRRFVRSHGDMMPQVFVDYQVMGMEHGDFEFRIADFGLGIGDWGTRLLRQLTDTARQDGEASEDIRG